MAFLNTILILIFITLFQYIIGVDKKKALKKRKLQACNAILKARMDTDTVNTNFIVQDFSEILKELAPEGGKNDKTDSLMSIMMIECLSKVSTSYSNHVYIQLN